jgi:CheY-like chemotaxis protein
MSGPARPELGRLIVTPFTTSEGSEGAYRREAPDVFVSDLVVSGEDGLQLMRDIRELDRAAGRVTPAAALTALARADDRRRALSAGYEMHVAKPVDASELVSTVEWLAQPHGAHAWN